MFDRILNKSYELSSSSRLSVFFYQLKKYHVFLIIKSVSEWYKTAPFEDSLDTNIIYLQFNIL